MISSTFIVNQYSGGGQTSSCHEPCGAVTTTPKQNLVSCNRWIMNPQYQSAGGSVDAPCFTLIARMDKMPPYLIEAVDDGELPSFIAPVKEGFMYCIYENDSEPMRKIKEFMALYGIMDIKMRMLKIPELKKIMGFPDAYVLVGTQAEQKKYIGNAVEVNMAKVLCEALCNTLSTIQKKVA